MSRPCAVRNAGLLLVPLALLLSGLPARAQDYVGGSCSGGACGGPGLWSNYGGRHEFCCGINKWCMPRPPCLCPKCVCPKPLCDPCNLENYGYYPVCWRPWLQQVNWSHCPVPPPSALAPTFHVPESWSPVESEELLPPPKKDKERQPR